MKTAGGCRPRTGLWKRGPAGLFPGERSLQHETTQLKLEAFRRYDWEQFDPRIIHRDTLQQMIHETIYDDLVNYMRDNILSETGK